MTDLVEIAVVSEPAEMLVVAIERTLASLISSGRCFCTSYNLASMSW